MNYTKRTMTNIFAIKTKSKRMRRRKSDAYTYVKIKVINKENAGGWYTVKHGKDTYQLPLNKSLDVIKTLLNKINKN